MQPVYNPETKKFEVPPAQLKAGAVAEETVRLSFPKGLSDTLAGYAKEDGMNITADTPRGTATKTVKAVQLYVAQAVREYIAAREEPEEPEVGEA